MRVRVGVGEFLAFLAWVEWEQEVVGAGEDVNVRVCVGVDIGA